MGHQTHSLSQQANLELRSQRDQIVNVVAMVKDIGLDLLSADKLAKDINYRRLLHIAVLYSLIVLLLICIILTVLHKMKAHHVLHIPILKWLGFSHHRQSP